MAYRNPWQFDNIKEALACRDHSGKEELNSNRIVIDSRLLKKGDIFIALKGNRVDGHAFIAQSLERGAAALILEKHSPDVPKDIPQFIVKDCYQALIDLATWRRKHYQGKVIAVTGSVGKTTQKEMIKLALQNFGKVYASPGNFNNEIGLSLSLANIDSESSWAVFELGARNKGDISLLTNIVRPDIAVLTKITSAHLVNFDSIHELTNTKLEIVEGLDKKGLLIAFSDQKARWQQIKEVAEKNQIPCISYGENDQADIKFSKVELNIDGSSVKINNKGKVFSYKTKALGSNLNETIAATVAVMNELKLSIKENDLYSFDFLAGRGKLYKVSIAKGHAYILDHSYNASPASMVSMFDAIDFLKSKIQGNIIAVLADMNELGKNSSALHVSIIHKLSKLGINILAIMGKEMRNACNIAEQKSKFFESKKDLIKYIHNILSPGDLLAIKGSNSFALSDVRQSFVQGDA